MSQLSVIPVRVYFQKIGRLKYLAHLDTMRAYMRALSRANIPLWFSEGFNPHPYMSFAMALSLGYEGKREVFDIRLEEEVSFDEIVKQVNQYLPEELALVGASTPVETIKEIEWADYELELLCENLPLAKKKLVEYFNRPIIEVEHRAKKHTYKMDVKKHIKNIKVTVAEATVRLSFRIATGVAYTLNPKMIIEDFMEQCRQEVQHTSYTRTGFFNKGENPFR